MNTPAIVNPSPVAAPGKHGNAQAEGSAPEVPFNQVLSREVANRSETANAERSPSNPATSTPAQTATNGSGKGPEKEKAADSGEKAPTDAAATDSSATQNTPIDLLELVVNIGQVTGADKAIVAPSGSEKKAPDGVLGIEAAKAGVATRIDAKIETAAGNIETSAATETDFAAMLKDSGDLQQAIETPKLAGAQKQSTETIVETQKRPAETIDMKLLHDKAPGQQPIELAKSGLQQGQPMPVATEASAIDLAAQAVETPDMQAVPPAQVATLTAAQQTVVHAAPGHAMNRLAPQVGTPAWDNALSQRIVWMVAGAEQSASLTLNPPDLGPLQVVLNVSNTTANATFVAAQPEVRQALEAAMPKLRDMLGDAGIQLGQATVSSGMQQNQNGTQAEPTHRSGFGSDTRTESADAQIHVPQGRSISSGNGLVDTFA